MTIEFQGAARTVTGSMHLLHINGKRVLLDCGLFQGKRADANERNRVFPFEPGSIDAVILSHAHIDHSGNLPGFVKQGYRGTIYCTPATKDLCSIMLADSGHIQEKDAEYLNKRQDRRGEKPVEPLYTVQDAQSAIEQLAGVPYEKEFSVLPNVTAKFADAGHILGSASVVVTITENGTTKKLGFTGDLGRWNMPIIKDPQFMGNVDALLSESTYGGIVHDPPEAMGDELAADIQRVLDRGGKIVVPAFSVGRTQDLVYALHILFDAGKLPRIPIFVDSPLAINATDIFKKHAECFDEEMSRHLALHHDPLGLNQLKYIRTAEESKKLNDITGSCMIISASGMCEAGRVLHHLAHTVEDARNAILIVGYQADNTLGKKFVDKETEVRILGTTYKRNAEIIVHNSFSAHADGNELLRYVGQFDRRQLQRIYLVHGELERQERFRDGLTAGGFPHVEIPVRGQKFDM
jgi:metallo-beta-lactamase family protein